MGTQDNGSGKITIGEGKRKLEEGQEESQAKERGGRRGARKRMMRKGKTGGRRKS